MTPKDRAAIQQALGSLLAFKDNFPDSWELSDEQAVTALQEALDHSGEATEMVQEPVLLAKGFSEWNLDAETGKFLADMITAGDEPIEVTLRLGFIRDDDGSVQYGLLANETEYPEEGAVLLLELNPINAAPQPVWSAEECDRVVKMLRYIQGIAERGEGRAMREDETLELFVLNYVKRLEQAPQPSQGPVPDFPEPFSKAN